MPDPADIWYHRHWTQLGVKTKLEVVEGGITNVDHEFLAHVVLPSEQTAGEWMKPQIAQAYSTGATPPLLPTGGVSHL